MPAKTIEEIQALIANDDIAAVTLDTSIFDQFGCNLAFRSLIALKQFKDSGIKLLFSRVTLGEVRAHIGDKARDNAQKLKDSINGFNKSWRLDIDKNALEVQLGLNNDPHVRATDLIKLFLDNVGGEILDVEPGVSIKHLVDIYFDAKAPFSLKDGKKSEFPDAIALLSLESWAQKNGTVLAISRDDDWRRYAETSPNIVCVNDLAKGLGLFNDASRVIAAKIVTDLREGRSPILYRSIERALENFAEEFDIEANASDYYEEEIEGSNVKSWKIEPGPINVVATDDETLTIAVEVEASIEFQARFNFSHWDGIDREYIRLPSGTSSTTEDVSLQVTITVYKDNQEDPDPFEVEVESPSLTIDFGEVEPDWT